MCWSAEDSQSKMSANSFIDPCDIQSEGLNLAFNLLRGEPFIYRPGDLLPGLSLPVERWDPKPRCLGDAGFVYIDPMIVFGFELLPRGLL